MPNCKRHYSLGTVLQRPLRKFKPRGSQTSGSWWNRWSWSSGSVGSLTSKARSCLQCVQHPPSSQTHTCYGSCRDGSCRSQVATKHLCSPCSRGLARSCTRFSCIFPLPAKSAGRTLWSWRARSLCSRRRARENCTWRASGYSPTAALYIIQISAFPTAIYEFAQHLLINLVQHFNFGAQLSNWCEIGYEFHARAAYVGESVRSKCSPSIQATRRPNQWFVVESS